MDKYIENLKIKSPLIHNITNMVTINDVANIELACGARPIMAMAPQEMEEVTGICDGLNINIGTFCGNAYSSPDGTKKGNTDNT